MVAKVQFEKIYSDGKDKQIKQLKSELDAYKIALKYFVDNGGHGASDIADNLLREVTHG